MEKVSLRELREIDDFASRILAMLARGEKATVVALSGELGAGKTTFVQACAKVLGVTETVTSPTFLVMKRYGISDTRYTTLIHIDAYRVEEEKELDVLRLRESFEHRENLIMVEWAERVSGYIPQDALWVELKLEQDGSRTIMYGKYGKHGKKD